MQKVPHELSIWREVYVAGSGSSYEYFKEEKVITIGGDKFTAPIHAFDITLVRNINGDATLKFTLINKYTDKTGELVDNPLLPLLVNETKLKFRIGEEYEEGTDFDYDNRWSDYTIKKIEKSSNDKTTKYEATQLFFTELGKNGWHVTLDSELNNNFGSVSELAERILDGSGWRVGEDIEVPYEYVVEPVFKASVKAKRNTEIKQVLTGEIRSIAKAEEFSGYFFYSDLNRTGDNGSYVWSIDPSKASLQFIKVTNPTHDDNRVIINDDYDLSYITETPDDLTITFNSDVFDTDYTVAGLSGRKLKETHRITFDNIEGKYVEHYVDSSGNDVYKWTKTNYRTSQVVSNMVANSSGFRDFSGWRAGEGSKVFATLLSNRKDEPEIENWIAFNYIGFKGEAFIELKNDTRLQIKPGDKFVYRIKGRIIGNINDLGQHESNNTILYDVAKGWTPRFKIGLSVADGETFEKPISYLASVVSKENDWKLKGYGIKDGREDKNTWIDEEGYFCGRYTYDGEETLVGTREKIRLYLKEELGLLEQPKAYFFIEDIQFFPNITIVVDDSELSQYPTDPITSTPEFEDVFYRYDNNGNRVELSGSGLTRKTKDGGSAYEAYRQFDYKEGSYLGGLSKLAEIFELWVKFSYKHNADGSLVYDEQGEGTNYAPIKEVTFYRFAPDATKNFAGFKYGINLSGIVRKVLTESFSSRTVVRNNNNEFSLNDKGSTSIVFAEDNFSKENEIINFNYYIAQGLLDYNVVLKDLYGFSSTDLGFLFKLRKYNEEYFALSEVDEQCNLELMNLEYQYELNKITLDTVEISIAEIKTAIEGYSEGNIRKQELMGELEVLLAQERLSKESVEILDELIGSEADEFAERTGIKGKRQTNREQMRENRDAAKALKKKFYLRYSRFLQEGIWTDDKYIDDNLYFYDALKISETNAFPQVSYDISVVSLEGHEEYRDFYKFNVGERTYIEDTDFFGWVKYGNYDPMPYRLEVIVNETTQNFSDPSKSSLTVQNFKTVYQDFFQKVHSAVNQLKNEGGAYAKAARSFSSTGELKPMALEQAWANNALILANANHQNITFDSSRGIEIMDGKNTTKRLRIVAGGILLSTDSGVTWKNALTADGLSASVVTAGTINTEYITIMSEGSPNFIWNKDGLTALVEDAPANFVRFSQYGLFAAKGEDGSLLLSELNSDSSFEDKMLAIKELGTFSLDWDGLTLNYSNAGVVLSPEEGLVLKYNDSGVSLTVNRGLEIFDETSVFSESGLDNLAGERYKPNGNSYVAEDKIPLVSLGKFKDAKQKTHYGLRMRNSLGQVTLSTDSTGNLWLANILNIGQKEKREELVVREIEVKVIDGKTTFSLANIPSSGSIKNITDGVNIVFSYDETKYVLDKNVAYFSLDSVDTIALFGYNPSPNLYALDLEYEIEIFNLLTIDGTSSLTNNENYILYAGHSDVEKAFFKVTSTGILEATEAKIRGHILAESGAFLGSLTIGETGQSGISGKSDSPFVIWSGATTGEPNFGVKHDGTLVAKNVDIEGKILATEGALKGRLYFGELKNSYIGPPSEAGDPPDYIGINNGVFSVGPDGVIRASKLELSNNIGGAYSIRIGESNDYSISMYDPSDIAKQVFGITSSGDVEVDGNLVLEGKLTTKNGIAVNGILQVGNTENSTHISIDGTGGTIYAPGWEIRGDGTASFSNINVRGKISSSIFEYDTKSSVGGDLLVSPSIILDEAAEKITGTNDFEFSLGRLGSDEVDLWRTVDRGMITLPTGEVYEDVSLFFNEGSGKLIIYCPVDCEVSSLPIGTIVISTSTNVNSILLTARGDNGPRIQIHGKIGQSGVKLDEVVLGNLAGIYSDYFSISAEETGLYANNAYLTGKLYLPSAGITDESNEENKHEGSNVRIWAGAAPENRTEAPFMVTEDGSLYATKGVFKGTVQAENSTFSGVLKVAGIEVEEDNYDHFFVAYKRNSGEHDPDSYIINIGYDGLSVWEGGLKIFSDYYSGWRSNKQEERVLPNTFYGFDANENTNPWPIFGVIDDFTEEGKIPRISYTHAHSWIVEEDNSSVYSLRHFPERLEFCRTGNTFDNTNDYILTEKTIWDRTSKELQIGRLNNKYGLFGENIYLGTANDQDTVRISGEQISIKENIETIYGEKIQAKMENNDMVFYYIGEV